MWENFRVGNLELVNLICTIFNICETLLSECEFLAWGVGS